MADTFADLPDALVRDLLHGAQPVAEAVRVRVSDLRARRAALRGDAEDRRLIRSVAELERPRESSVAGIDGSYQARRLTSLELCGVAAVAVEGTSKEAVRHWPEPRHRLWTGPVPHHKSTTLLLRGLMIAMELELAVDAPHDLVLLDGAFASLLIYLNQGLSNLDDAPPELGEALHELWHSADGPDRLIEALGGSRVIAAPKFTSRNELVDRGGLRAPPGVDGRTLATTVLGVGEFTDPLPVYGESDEDGEPFHLPVRHCPQDRQQLVIAALRETRVVYFRPWAWVPALRLELPRPVANSETRLAAALEGVRSQFFSPAVVEPYPLFLADRMVKSLGAGVQVVEQQVAQHLAADGIDAEMTMLYLNHYRTEGGRG